MVITLALVRQILCCIFCVGSFCGRSGASERARVGGQTSVAWLCVTNQFYGSHILTWFLYFHPLYSIGSGCSDFRDHSAFLTVYLGIISPQLTFASLPSQIMNDVFTTTNSKKDSTRHVAKMGLICNSITGCKSDQVWKGPFWGWNMFIVVACKQHMWGQLDSI